MAETPPVTHKSARLEVWWPLVFGVTIGVEIMMGALVLFGPAPMKPEIAAQLTNQGRLFVVPERDLVIYAAGCVLTVLLTAGFAWLRRFRTRAIDGTGASDEARAIFCRRSCESLSVAAALFLLQLGLLFLIQAWWKGDAGASPWFPAGVLAGPVVAALVMATLGASWDWGIAPGPVVRLVAGTPSGREWSAVVSWRWFDVAVVVLICAIIYIPDWRAFFGWYFQATDWCRHWSSFVVGPMLGFHHGKALGAEVYSQYGVGWAVVFSTLHGFAPMTIPKFVHAAILYGCVYFIGVYVFLRLALRQVIWAAAGVLLAISLQLFHGLVPHEFLWEWPSSTILRSPMDIWFFIAILLHLRTGRTAWAVAAGACTGLAVFFETDTGIHLTLTLATYWTLVVIKTWQLEGSPSVMARQALISVVTAVVVLLAGLAIASRGTILRPEFWTGWLEAILTYAGGMGMLPMAKVPSLSLLLFAVFITVYLGALGRVVVGLFHRALSARTVLLGCIGAYGLLALLLFVGRSETSKMFHVAVPLSLIVALAVARFTTDEEREGCENCGPGGVRTAAVQTGIPVTRLASWCGLLGVAVWLTANPVFRHYPGALQTLLAGSPMRNVKGPPPEDQGFVPEFGAVVSRLRQHVSAGRTVAVLDDIDTVFYLAAGTAPWWRFSPSLSLMIRKSEVADLQRALATRGPEMVVIRATGDFAARWFYQEEDVWRAAHQTVQSHYELENTIGNFEFWRRREK